MSIFTDSQEILTNVLTNKETFSKTLKSFLETNVRSNEELSKINHIYDGFFSRYYYFEQITKEYLTKATNLLIVTIGVAFVSGRELKLNSDEILSFVEDTFNNNKEKLTDELRKAFLNYKAGKDVEFKGIETGSREHLSIMFNLPLWFVSMTINQRGKDGAKDIFKSFLTRNSPNYYMLNSLKNLDDAPKEELAKFNSSDKLIYTTKEKKNPLIKNFTFVRTNPSYEKIFANLPKFNNKYITVYEAEPNNFYLRFLNENIYKSNVINIAMNSINDNPEIIKEVALLQIKDLFIYESTVGQLIARLAFKQDCLFYLPYSSNMTKFFTLPEFRVLFDVESLDKIIKNDKKDLYEISTYVEDKSYLVYLVNTLDKKEGTKLIEDFIKDNDEFSIVKEEEIFPTTQNKSFVYYCILKRTAHA